MTDNIHQPHAGAVMLCMGAEGTESVNFDELFRRHSVYVAGIAYRILGREDEVDDVVQDVFSKALAGIGKLRDIQSVKSWLSVISVRCASRRLRRRKARRFIGLEDDYDYGDVVFEGATQEHAVLLGNVYAILDGLPVRERIAWSLRYIEEESLEEVARLCSCSLATAKRRIFAAHQAVTRGLSDEQ